MYKALDISYDEFARMALPPAPVVDPTFLDINSIYIRYNPVLLQSCKHSLPAKQFLRKRGLPFSIADKHGLRYADSIHVNSRLPYERVVIVPIFEQNKLISMEIRSTDPDVAKKDKVRYPKNTSVNTLYDIDNLDRHKTLYAVEGLLDTLVLRKYPEFANSTAVFGSEITHRQKALLQQFDSVVYIPDNDAAGDRTVDWFASNKMTNISILKVPQEINGVAIKDVGDVEAKCAYSVGKLLARNWLAHTRRLNIT